MGNILFRASYVIVHLLAAYSLIMGIFFQKYLNFYTTFMPILFLGIPSVFVIYNIKCKICGARVYTPDNLRSIRGGLSLPLHRFQNCPKCGHVL